MPRLSLGTSQANVAVIDRAIKKCKTLLVNLWDEHVIKKNPENCFLVTQNFDGSYC
jgi:hypothetical protein